MADQRRLIPRTDELLADPQLASALASHGYDKVKRALGHAQQRARTADIAVADVLQATLSELSIESRAAARPVLNGTGVIIHTNLGRAPLSQAAVEAVIAASGYTDLEFDLGEGVRARRGRGALAALTAAVPAAEAVHVVNNTAAALLLSALVLAPGREIIISRGELVEIGDGFRIPDLLSCTGAVLREVGSTNRTHLRDYSDAISPRTGFILKVHPSNFRVEGFTAAVTLSELRALGVPLVADIGSGLLHRNPILPHEPDATTALTSGADLVLASGDKLLGGPQAGLMFGRAELIERLRRHPAARALRVDKLTLAALTATLDGPATPVARALTADVTELIARAQALAARLRAHGVEADAVESAAAVGGGGAPGLLLPSAAISLRQSLAAPLRAGTPAVVGRLERGRCLVDLLCIPAEADEQLVAAVLMTAAGSGSV